MKPYAECGPCILKWIYERVAGPLTDAERFTVMRKVMSVLSGDFDPSENLGSLCNRCLDSVRDYFPASAAAYQEFKVKCNESASTLLEDARLFIEKGPTRHDRFARACAIAALGNVSPIGAPSAPFEFSHVKEVLRGKAPLPLPRGETLETVFRARRVMYLADNAGEIGFDSLLISLLQDSGSQVSLIVKEEPFFDDASRKDASYFGLDRVADAILSVSNIFIPEDASGNLADVFAQSDLVVSKGTGNFEALKGNDRGKRMIFLLKAKCRAVSEQMGVDVGEFVAKVEQ